MKPYTKSELYDYLNEFSLDASDTPARVKSAHEKYPRRTISAWKNVYDSALETEAGIERWSVKSNHKFDSYFERVRATADLIRIERLCAMAERDVGMGPGLRESLSAAFYKALARRDAAFSNKPRRKLAIVARCERKGAAS